MKTLAAQGALFSTAEKEFRKLTGDRYTAMVKRFAERRDKNKRLYRVGREVPFTREQYQAWVLERLGGAFNGACKCYYECGAWINLHTMNTDHRDPPNRGGSLGLENLAACCKTCNAMKGNLPENWFKFLKQCLEAMPASIADEIKRRLVVSIQLVAGRQWGRKSAAKKSQMEAIGDGTGVF